MLWLSVVIVTTLFFIAPSKALPTSAPCSVATGDIADFDASPSPNMTAVVWQNDSQSTRVASYLAVLMSSTCNQDGVTAPMDTLTNIELVEFIAFVSVPSDPNNATSVMTPYPIDLTSQISIDVSVYDGDPITGPGFRLISQMKQVSCSGVTMGEPTPNVTIVALCPGSAVHFTCNISAAYNLSVRGISTGWPSPSPYPPLNPLLSPPRAWLSLPQTASIGLRRTQRLIRSLPVLCQLHGGRLRRRRGMCMDIIPKRPFLLHTEEHTLCIHQWQRYPFQRHSWLRFLRRMLPWIHPQAHRRRLLPLLQLLAQLLRRHHSRYSPFHGNKSHRHH